MPLGPPSAAASRSRIQAFALGSPRRCRPDDVGHAPHGPSHAVRRLSARCPQEDKKRSTLTGNIQKDKRRSQALWMPNQQVSELAGRFPLQELTTGGAGGRRRVLGAGTEAGLEVVETLAVAVLGTGHYVVVDLAGRM